MEKKKLERGGICERESFEYTTKTRKKDEA